MARSVAALARHVEVLMAVQAAILFAMGVGIAVAPGVGLVVLGLGYGAAMGSVWWAWRGLAAARAEDH